MSLTGLDDGLFLLPSTAGNETTVVLYEVPMKYIYILALVANVGVILNVLILVIWSNESTYIPSTYLFKTLAVADILYMTSWFPFNHNKAGNRFLRLFFNTLCFGNRKFGLLATLILSVVRFIMIFRPEDVTELLSRFRIKTAVIGTMTYSIWLHGLMCGYYILKGTDESSYSWMMLPRKIIPYIVPSSLQIILMVSVVLKIEYESKRSTIGSEDTLRTATFGASFESNRHSSRRIIYVVLTMCVLSFVSYQISTILNVVFTDLDLVSHYRNYITMSENYTGFFNSSMNFFFYLFIARFRITFFNKVDNFKKGVREFSWAPAFPSSVGVTGAKLPGARSASGNKAYSTSVQ